MSKHWVGVGFVGALFVAAACGGSTKASKDEPSAAGSVVTAGSSSAVAGTASLGGGGGGSGGGAAASPGEAGQGGEAVSGPPLGTGIVPDALAGCRGPSDVGCEVCYWTSPDGLHCTRESGGDAEYLDYLAVDGLCPADGPPCAHCSYAEEQHLRALGERSECGCITGPDTGTAPCTSVDSPSCGCYCNALNSVRRACPPLDN